MMLVITARLTRVSNCSLRDGLMVISENRDWMMVIATMPQIGAPWEVIFFRNAGK